MQQKFLASLYEKSLGRFGGLSCIQFRSTKRKLKKNASFIGDSDQDFETAIESAYQCAQQVKIVIRQLYLFESNQKSFTSIFQIVQRVDKNIKSEKVVMEILGDKTGKGSSVGVAGAIALVSLALKTPINDGGNYAVTGAITRDVYVLKHAASQQKL